MKRFLPTFLRCTLFVLLTFFPLLLVSPSAVHAQWEPDVRLTYNDSSSSTSWPNARCIVARGDTVHVVWYDQRDGNLEVYYKRSTDSGISWSSDTRVSFDSSWSEHPSVAASGAVVHVAWVDSRNGWPNTDIYYKRSTDGGSSWGPENRLTYDPGSSDYLSLAASGMAVHAVWTDDRDGHIGEIYYKRSTDAGATWQADTSLTMGLPNSYYPCVAASGSEVHLVWWSENGGYHDIFYKRSLDNGMTWSGNALLTTVSNWAGCPTIAVSGSMVHIVWEDDRDSPQWPEIYYKKSSDRGITWGPDVRLTYNPAPSWEPNVAASGQRVHVVWYDERDSMGTNLFYLRSLDDGITWGPETRLTYPITYKFHPFVSATGSKTHVVWTDDRAGNYEIYYKRNPTDSSSGVEVSPPVSLSPCPLVPLSVIPSPFTSYASVPGHSSERFALYDISGRKVGTYKGDRIGSGLSAGIYFLKPENKDAKPLRIVKLR